MTSNKIEDSNNNKDGSPYLSYDSNDQPIMSPSKEYKSYMFSGEWPPLTEEEKLKIQKEKEAVGKVSIGQLFKYADNLDKLCMVLGSIGAACLGVVMPAFSLLFGELIDAFNKPPDELYAAITRVALLFLYVGFGAFAAGYSKLLLW